MAEIINNEKQDPIENFLYIVAMTLLLIILPIFKVINMNMWTTTIIVVIITFISYHLIKITTAYLKRKITITSFKAKRLPIYIIYFLIYFIVRITLDI